MKYNPKYKFEITKYKFELLLDLLDSPEYQMGGLQADLLGMSGGGRSRTGANQFKHLTNLLLLIGAVYHHKCACCHGAYRGHWRDL